MLSCHCSHDSIVNDSGDLSVALLDLLNYYTRLFDCVFLQQQESNPGAPYLSCDYYCLRYYYCCCCYIYAPTAILLVLLGSLRISAWLSLLRLLSASTLLLLILSAIRTAKFLVNLLNYLIARFPATCKDRSSITIQSNGSVSFRTVIPGPRYPLLFL